MGYFSCQAENELSPVYRVPRNARRLHCLLEIYTALAPHLAPTPTSEQLNRISHPDLHLDNIFVDPETYCITSIIDWQ